MRHENMRSGSDGEHGRGRGGHGRGRGEYRRGCDDRGHRHHGGRGEKRRRGGRARRGDVRFALLALLEEEQANGYALIKRIQEKTDGVWRTSPGSVYPTLSQLVDEGLIVSSTEEGGRNQYELSDEGREYVSENRERITAIWNQDEADLEGAGALRQAKHNLMHVLREIEVSGDADRADAAAQIVNRLAEDLK